MALRYAGWFISQGVRRGDLVSFYMHNSAEFMFAWLGLLAINAAPAMINYNLRGRALTHCIKVAESRLVLADEELSGFLAEAEGLEGVRTITLDDAMKKGIAERPVSEVPREYSDGTTPTSTVALRYTRCVRARDSGQCQTTYRCSGTTGFPKAVNTPISRTYSFVYGKFADLQVRGGPDGDRWYICMPVCHATAGSVAMSSLIMGVTLCLV
jgi:acyl-CoA synthetase (AMP-forming)/AMP-acid ligase II